MHGTLFIYITRVRMQTLRVRALDFKEEEKEKDREEPRHGNGVTLPDTELYYHAHR